MLTHLVLFPPPPSSSCIPMIPLSTSIISSPVKPYVNHPFLNLTPRESRAKLILKILI